MVVVFESSAKKSQRLGEALGDSKNENKAQLIQAAFPNMVTYEFRSSRLYLKRLFLVISLVVAIMFSSARLFPDAKKRATEITQRRNQTERWASTTTAPA